MIKGKSCWGIACNSTEGVLTTAMGKSWRDTACNSTDVVLKDNKMKIHKRHSAYSTEEGALCPVKAWSVIPLK